MAIVLFADVTTQSTWKPLTQFNIDVAGSTHLNVTIALTSGPSNFWLRWQTVLVDSTSATNIPPHSCSGSSCFSFFFPRGLIRQSETHNVSSEANVYIRYNVPGVQIEYYPFADTDPPWNNFTDCRLYGLQNSTLQLCIKRLGNDFMAGEHFVTMN